MKCPECHLDLKMVQDDNFGAILVCALSHWWVKNFKNFQLDRLSKGETKRAA